MGSGCRGQVSHRLGLPGTPLPPWRFVRALPLDGWRGLHREGLAWAEQTPPRWAPGRRCLYHHLSWSFIVAGFVQGSSLPSNVV